MGYCIVGMFQQSICAILLLPLTIPKGYLLFIIQTILSTPFNPNKEAQKTAKMPAPSRPTFLNLFDFYVSRISHFFGASCFPLFPIICAFYYPNHIPCTPTYPDNCLCQLGTIKVKKVDSSTNRGLSGAKFLIVNTWTGQQLTGTTGSDGYVTFDKVHMGEWAVIESQAPSGYVASGSNYKVELQPGGSKTINVTVKNEKAKEIDDDFDPDNDNVVWASELTRSFTNETNLT